MVKLPEGKTAILMCRPVDPNGYPPLKQAIWRQMVADSGSEPMVYPGSTQRACQSCKIPIWVGPRQEALLAEGGPALVLCMMCVGEAASSPDVDEVQIADLGNPYQRRSGMSFVTTDRDGGYEVACEGCGRKARLQDPVPQGKVVLCPVCIASR